MGRCKLRIDCAKLTSDMGRIKLKIDCAKLTADATAKLLDELSMFITPVFVGGDTIYVEGKVHHDIYAIIWKILDNFNVTVD